MFKGFDWQHWVVLFVGLAVTAGPDIATSLGADGLSGPASTVTRVVAFMSIIGAMLKASPFAGRPAAADRGPERGFVRIRGMFAIAVIGSLGAGGLATTQTACTKAQGQALVAGIPQDAVALGCVAAAAASGLSLGVLAGKCGLDILEAGSLLLQVVEMQPDAGTAQSTLAAMVAPSPAFLEARANPVIVARARSRR